MKIVYQGLNECTVPLMLEVMLPEAKRRERESHRCPTARGSEPVEPCLIRLRYNPNEFVPCRSKTTTTSYRTALQHKKHNNPLSHAQNASEYFFGIFVYYFQENAPVPYNNQCVTDVYCEGVNEFMCKYVMWRQLYYYMF